MIQKAPMHLLEPSCLPSNQENYLLEFHILPRIPMAGGEVESMYLPVSNLWQALSVTPIM